MNTVANLTYLSNETIEQTLYKIFTTKKQSTRMSFANEATVEVLSSGGKKYVAVVSYRLLSNGKFEYKGDMIEGVEGNGTKVRYWFTDVQRTAEEIREVVDHVAFFLHHGIPLEVIFKAAGSLASTSGSVM